MFPESRYTAPSARCPHPEWWHSQDPDATEVEVSELLWGLVRAIQPDLVVETGTYRGQSAWTMGQALLKNGHGRLVSYEIDGPRAAQARRKLRGLPATVVHGRVQDAPPPETATNSGIGFAFFDSDPPVRADEFRFLRRTGRFAPGALVAFHDTSEHHPVALEGIRELERRHLLRPILFPTPRGFTLASVE